MADDIELAVNLIQAQNRAVLTTLGLGGAKAPDLASYPTVLDTPNLPYILTWPAEGSWYIKGGRAKQDVRVFRIIAFYEVLGQSEIPARAVGAVRLLQAMRDKWITASVVSLQDPVGGVSYQITAESSPEKPHSDGGLISSLSFGGRQFHGFEIRLNVRTYWV